MTTLNAAVRPEHMPENVWPYDIFYDQRDPDSERVGDMIAYRALAENKVVVTLVDVAGRGSVARPLAYYISTNLLGLLLLHCPLGRAISIANRDIQRDFAAAPLGTTAFAAVLDPGANTMHYVCAGSQAPLILARNRSHRHLAVNQPAFGSTWPIPESSSCVPFGPGDELIVVTRSVPALKDDRGVAFGTGGVLRAALNARTAGEDPARALMDQAFAYASATMSCSSAAIVIKGPN